MKERRIQQLHLADTTIDLRMVDGRERFEAEYPLTASMGITVAISEDDFQIETVSYDTHADSELVTCCGNAYESGGLRHAIIGLRTKTQHNKRYAGFPRGRDLFIAAIETFDQKKPVDVLHAVWHGGDNFNQFYAQYSIKGVSKTQAALSTWTGQMAQELGFINNIEVRIADANSGSEKGKVEVDFYRNRRKRGRRY